MTEPYNQRSARILMEIIKIKKLAEIREANRYGIVHPSKATRMLNRIVLDLTYECTLKCLNCNRFCGILPRKSEIELAKITEFVNHSIEVKKKWAHIYIAGGEPALHSQIYKVFHEIDRYVTFHKQEFHTNLIVKYFTNNYSKESKEVLKKLPDYIINNSNKQNSNPRFKPICVAPLDLGFYDDDNLIPCKELYQCGMTLNHRGYYPCAEAAAIDDIFLKKNLAIKRLKDVTFRNMAKILHHTCRYCGYYFEPVGYRKSSVLMLSASWEIFLNKQDILLKPKMVQTK
jgi:MoaA/NifB/PqqE/SkfB family radical SAM enzyme